MASEEHQTALMAGVEKELKLYRYPDVGANGLRMLSFQDTCVFRGLIGGVMGGGLGAAFGILMSSMGPGLSSMPGANMPNPMNPVMATGPARPAAAAAAAAGSSAPTGVVSVRPPAGVLTAGIPRVALGPQLLPPMPAIPVTPMDPIYGGQSALESSSWSQVKQMARDTGRQAKGNFKTWGIMSGTYTFSEAVVEQTRGTSDELNPLIAGCATGGFLAARSGPQGMAVGCAGFAAFSYAMEKVMHSM